MSKRLSVPALILILTACVDTPLAVDEQPPLEPSYSQLSLDVEMDVSGRYLVMLRPGVPNRLGNDVEALGGTVRYSHPIGIAAVSGFTDAAAAELGAKPYVLRLDADAVLELDPMMGVGAVESVGATPASPDDPEAAFFFSRQWNMRAVKADEAWATGRTGDESVTVAILDTGIDYEYPDLEGRVDLARSASFIPEEDELVEFFFPGNHPATDLNWHGTHVAAIAVSNSEVIAGVTSKPTLMGVKVCDVYGSCPMIALVMGVLHAVDHGADVINISSGGWFLKPGVGQLVGYLNRVFNYANRAGVTVVVAAGNDAWDLDHNGNEYTFYCDAPNVICVSATGPTDSEDVWYGPWTEVDAPAPYTNFGRSSIGVAAPGGTGNGWVWSACPTTSLSVPACQRGIYILGAAGTSQAAPHVAGLAALLVEDLGRNPAKVRALIQNSADDLGRPGVDPFYGRGRINVLAAVSH